MALALFKEEIDDVQVELQRLRQANTIRSGSSGSRLPNPQRDPFAHRYYLRDGCVAVEHRNRFAAADDSKIFAETRLEVRDPDFFHTLIMTRDGHDGNHAGYQNRRV